MQVRKGWEAEAHCNGCLASIHTITYDTEQKAIDAATSDWNQRANNDSSSQETYESEAYKKYTELIKYYRKHPIKYVEDFCNNYNIKLYWYQKAMLMMGLGKGETKEAQQINKILRAFRIK